MKRIVVIDVLRGVALLGLLLINITSFAMPSVAYYNPVAYGGNDSLNQFVYAAVHILVDQKFMAIFSLLFGASTMLLLTKLEQKGQKPRFYFVRNIWLFVLGVLHGILLWEGDILVILRPLRVRVVLFSAAFS